MLRSNAVAVVILCGLIIVPTRAQADDALIEARARALAIFSRRCVECHGAERQRKGLRLDSLAGVLAGGRSGPAIVAGQPEASRLVDLVHAEGRTRMPPQGDRLGAEEIDALSAWIRLETGDARTSSDRGHWAWRAVEEHEPPQAEAATHPIDAFLREGLDAAGLTPNATAAPHRALRRLALDLTGLPPTETEMRNYLDDPSDEAWSRAVDLYLDSPAFGERMAAHWLDLARYADTRGYEADRARTIWPYRDWVIRAFNTDMAFDRFTLLQLAGDLLPDATTEDLVATAFHRNTMNNDEGGTDDEEFRAAAVVDRVNTTFSVWMGTTLACAQCHDHKYDPITQREYFQVYAVFDQSADTDRPDEAPHVPWQSDERRAESARLDGEIAAIEASLRAWSAERSGEVKTWVEARRAERAATSAVPDEESRLLDADPELLFALRAGGAEGDVARRDELAARRALVQPVPVPVMRELEGEARRKTRVHLRGSFRNLGDEVQPGVPAVFDGAGETSVADRLDLARWLCAPENPLSARVVVNRYWALLFGRGLVATEEDFGTQGDIPSHPELLDWLAHDFIANGYSTKSLLSRIVTAAAYRRDSSVDARSRDVDPLNTLLWRGPNRRLDAEALRDQALAVSGLLSRRLGGPSVMPDQPDGIWQVVYNGEVWRVGEGDDRYRRGLYTYWRRTSPHPVMSTFDAPSREVCVVRRVPSNTPLQALTALNEPAFVAAARRLAAQFRDGESTRRARVGRIFERALLRRAEPEEMDVLMSLHERERRRFIDDPAAAASLIEIPLDDESACAELAALVIVANVVLNLDEFLTR